MFEYLTVEQSELLKRLSDAPLSYENLTDSEKQICNFLIKNGYVHATKKGVSDTSIKDVFRHWEVKDKLTITENGKMYLINEKLSYEQIEYLKQKLNAVKEIANVAKEDSSFAKKEASSSKRISIITIAISVAAIVAQLLISLLLQQHP